MFNRLNLISLICVNTNSSFLLHLSVSATTLESGSSGSDASLPPICNGAYKCSGGSSEIPCSVGNTDFHWTTGGGFSDYISSPAWQTDARTQYLASGVTFPASNPFNSSNRFYADVAAFGSRLLVVQNQQVSVSAGSECFVQLFF